MGVEEGDGSGGTKNRSLGWGDFIAAHARREDGMTWWHDARAWRARAGRRTRVVGRSGAASGQRWRQ
jgi:hypothetical protein